ncbi:hypothetical protein L9F63_024969, partial [Diploptera punctata]
LEETTVTLADFLEAIERKVEVLLLSSTFGPRRLDGSTYLTPLQELSQFSRKISTDEQGRRLSYAFAQVRCPWTSVAAGEIRGFLIFHIIAHPGIWAEPEAGRERPSAFLGL